MIKISVGKSFAIIDEEDFELVSSIKWYESKSIIKGKYYNSYALGKLGTDKNRKTVSMHRLIMGNPEGLVIDHINHNGLDNRKSNLRAVTFSENQKNLRADSIPRQQNLWEYVNNNRKIPLSEYEFIKTNIHLSAKQLAKKYNVTDSLIYFIRNHK